MYRTVVTICTAKWSLYVPPSGHYMYRTVVTICAAQWSLYVPHSGHYMYRTVVTICTTSLTFNNSTFCPHTVFMCFVWISEQTAIISLYNINWLVFVTETQCVCCAIRTGYHNDACKSILFFDNSPSYCWDQLLECYDAHFLSDVTNSLSVSCQCVYWIQRVSGTPVALSEHSATGFATHIALLMYYLCCLIGNYL